MFIITLGVYIIQYLYMYMHTTTLNVSTTPLDQLATIT